MGLVESQIRHIIRSILLTEARRATVSDFQLLIGAVRTGRWDNQTQAKFVLYVNSINPTLVGVNIEDVKRDWKTNGPKITNINGVAITNRFTPDLNGIYQFANMIKNTRNSAPIPPPVSPEVPGVPASETTASIAHVRTPRGDTARKLLIISPGIDNVYGWQAAADDHARRAANILPDEVAFVVAKNSGTSIDSVLSDIKKDPVLSKISDIEVLGFSGGGNTTIQFMKNSSNANSINKFYLADPYWRDARTADVPFADKTTLAFNTLNWAQKYGMGPKFDKMSSSVSDGGGSVVDSKLGHVQILDDLLRQAAV